HLLAALRCRIHADSKHIDTFSLESRNETGPVDALADNFDVADLAESVSDQIDDYPREFAFRIDIGIGGFIRISDDHFLLVLDFLEKVSLSNRGARQAQ